MTDRIDPENFIRLYENHNTDPSREAHLEWCTLCQSVPKAIRDARTDWRNVWHTFRLKYVDMEGAIPPATFKTLIRQSVKEANE